LAKHSKICSQLWQKGTFFYNFSPSHDAGHYLEQINGNYDGVLPLEVIDTNDREKTLPRAFKSNRTNFGPFIFWLQKIAWHEEIRTVITLQVSKSMMEENSN
jgi:hypothetical protein